MRSRPFTTYAVALAVALLSLEVSIVVCQRLAEAWFASQPSSGTYFVTLHAPISVELEVFALVFTVNAVAYGVVSLLHAPLDVRLVSWQMRVTFVAFILTVVPEVVVMLAKPASWLFRVGDPVRVAFPNVAIVMMGVAIACVPLGVVSVVVASRARRRAARG